MFFVVTQFSSVTAREEQDFNLNYIIVTLSHYFFGKRFASIIKVSAAVLTLLNFLPFGRRDSE